jgi:hypothetical protein
MYTGENQPKESRNRNLMRLSEQVLGLVSVFKEARGNIEFIFLMNEAG